MFKHFHTCHLGDPIGVIRKPNNIFKNNISCMVCHESEMKTPSKEILYPSGGGGDYWGGYYIPWVFMNC